MYLILDTETTTFPSDKVPATHPSQAHICQMALLQLDESFNELTSLRTLIKPRGWRISDGAYNVHGISLEMCQDIGIPIEDALDIFHECLRACKVLVGHNIKFDTKMVDIELMCAKKIYPPHTCTTICTMELMTPIMKMPQTRKNSFGSTYKWPKLQEAYSFVTKGESMQDVHEALVDARATAKVLQYLVTNKFVNVSQN
jgi:DNA polymerase III epsilon subunit-like protein